MGIVQHTVNGRALYEAMKVGNGIEHIRGEWFVLDANGNPAAGCALGLMAINLKIRGNESTNFDANLYSQLLELPLVLPPESKWFKLLGTLYTTVASAIIYLNDAVNPNNTKEYLLPTFEDVHEMVHDILEPYFSRQFVVDVWEFDAPDFSTLQPRNHEPDDYVDDYDHQDIDEPSFAW